MYYFTFKNREGTSIYLCSEVCSIVSVLWLPLGIFSGIKNVSLKLHNTYKFNTHFKRKLSFRTP